MIYKDYSSKIEDLDEKGRVLVAANAIGNEDGDGDISAKGSFDLTLKKDFPRLRWFLNHDKNILLGVPLEGHEDGTHLKMLGQLNMKKQISRDVYEDYKLWAEHGRTLEHSVGVRDIKRNNTNKSIVEEWQLREYSTLTSWGANPNTPMLGIKSLEEEKDFAEYQMRKGNYSDERFRKIEQKLKDILKLLGNSPAEVLNDPMTPENPVEAAAFNPARLKAAADALALRTFRNKLNIKQNG